MYRLVRDTRLPDEPPLPGASWDYGVDLDWLKKHRDAWADEFDWRAVEREMNAFDHYTVVIESVSVHFVHQRSPRPDATPILLLHGWPGESPSTLAAAAPRVSPRALLQARSTSSRG